MSSRRAALACGPRTSSIPSRFNSSPSASPSGAGSRASRCGAPSPTGPLHLGNLRTALLAWLFARSSGSRFLVRIEDLDPVASREEHVTGQLDDLRAFGLAWDGPVVRQSARRPQHDA